MATVAELRALPSAEVVFLVRVTLGDGTVLRLSDRNIEAWGEVWEDYLTGASEFGEEVRRADSDCNNPDTRLTFRNDTITVAGTTYTYLSDFIGAKWFGSRVEAYELYRDELRGDAAPALIFVGTLDAPASITTRGFFCTVSNLVEYKAQAFVQEVVTESVAAADTEDQGKVVPDVIGASVLSPCLRTQWGAASTLFADITKTATELELTDATGFPAAGSLRIGGEVLNYSSKGTGANQHKLYGLTRGVGSTSPKAHPQGTQVVEKLVKYRAIAAGHPLGALEAAYIEIDNRLYRVTSGATLVNEGGKAYLDLDQRVSINPVLDDIEIADALKIVTRQPPATTTVTRRADNAIWWNPGNDNDDPAQASSQYVNFSGRPAGTIVSAKWRYRYKIMTAGLMDSNGMLNQAPPALSDEYRGKSLYSILKQGSATGVTIAVMTREMRDFTTLSGSVIQAPCPVYLDLYDGEIEAGLDSWVDQKRFYFKSAPGIMAAVYDVEQILEMKRTDADGNELGDETGGEVERLGTNAPDEFESLNQQYTTFTITFPPAPAGTISGVTLELHLEGESGEVQNTRGIIEVWEGNSGPHIFSAGGFGMFGRWVVQEFIKGGFRIPMSQYRENVRVRVKSESWDGSDLGGSLVRIARAVQRFNLSGEAAVVSPSRSGAITKSGTAGYSAFATSLFIRTAGAVDADGAITGTVGAVLSRPDHVIRYWLTRRMAFAQSEIDTASFAAAGTWYASRGYTLAGALLDEVDPRDVLAAMARSCRSVVKYVAGKWYLDPIPDAKPTVTRVVTRAELAGRGAEFVFSTRSRNEIANRIRARYKKYRGPRAPSDPWRGSVEVAGAVWFPGQADQVTKTVDLEWCVLAAQAAGVAGVVGLESRPLLTVTFSVFWENFDLVPGASFRIGDGPFAGRDFFIETVTRDGPVARIQAVEWWS